MKNGWSTRNNNTKVLLKVLKSKLQRESKNFKGISKEEAIIFEQFQDVASILELVKIAAIIRFTNYPEINANFCSAGYGWTEKCEIPCKHGLCGTCSFANGEMAELDDFTKPEQFVEKAIKMKKLGASDYKIVTTGCILPEKKFTIVLEAFRLIRRVFSEDELKLCASLGILNKKRLKQLRNVGVTRLNHNIEVSEGYAKKLAELTDTNPSEWKKRIETVKGALEVGMGVCCGGMIFYGNFERPEDRVNLYFTLKELGVRNSPLNIYVPREDIPMLKNRLMQTTTDHGFRLFNLVRSYTPTPYEILREAAIFRLISPHHNIILNAGSAYLNEFVGIIFLVCNKLAIGGYLNQVQNEISKKYINVIHQTIAETGKNPEKILDIIIGKLLNERKK